MPTVPIPAVGVAGDVPTQTNTLDRARAQKILINRLNPFNGEGSLETFLAKFDQMATYLKWSEADKFHHLCASLQGPAAQVLWGLTSNATAESVVTLLRTRFGNELHIERFRAELQARRRKSGETLQMLYLDIVRMVLLAHPNSASDLTQHVAREAFINALDNVALQVCVMDKQPATIEEALNIAIRLEAYELALQANGAPPSTFSKGEGGHPKTKSVRTADSSAAEAGRSEANQLMQKQILKMQQEFAEYRNRVSLEEPPTPQPSTGTQVHSGTSRKGMTASQAKSKGGSRGRVQCTNCDKFGHRAKDCARPPRYSPPRDEGSRNGKGAEVKAIRGSTEKGFAEASFRDKQSVVCTLDTSVRRNMIEPALVHRDAMEPIEGGDELLYGKPHPATIGQFCAVFRIEGEQLITTVADVVPGTKGVTLGSDWLHSNVRQWNVSTGKVDTYDGSFQVKKERDVRVVRTSV